MDNAVHPAAIKYLTHKGIPTLLAALAAIVLVLSIALEAQANLNY